MSSALYPLGAIERLVVTPFERTIADAFEDGTTTTRRIWAAQHFKRRFEVDHAPLTAAEWRYLRSFYSQRNGLYDSFWFRDNINRGGNANVRFAAQLPADRDAALFNARVLMEEIGPVRAIPENDEVLSPTFWWDANRDIYFSHAGTVTQEASVFDAGTNGTVLPVWNTASPLAGLTAQYQFWDFTSNESAITAANLSAGGVQAAVSLFAIVKNPTVAAQHIIGCFGTMTSGAALGLQLSAAGYYQPYLGGAETFTNAKFLNSAIETWRTVCAVWTGSSNNVTLYVNGASIGTDAVTRSFVTKPAVFGAAPDLTLNIIGKTAHFMGFIGTALTLANVKTIHNLLAYQYGLALV